MIAYAIITSLINTVAGLTLALLVAMQKPRKAENVTFTWFAITGALWSASYFLWQISDSEAHANLWARIFSASAILIPVAYYHFASIFTGRRSAAKILIGYILCVIFAICSFSPLIIRGLEPRGGFQWWPVPGPLYPLYLLTFFGYFSAAAWDLVQGIRETTGLKRNQITFVLLGTVVGFIGGSTNFFLWYDIPIQPIGNGFVALYVVAVGYAIIRFRLMDVSLIAARLAAYALLSISLALIIPGGIYLLGFIKIAKSGSLIPLYLISLIYTALLIPLIPVFRRDIDRGVERRVRGDIERRREVLRRYSARSSADDENKIFTDASLALQEALGVANVAFYVRSNLEPDYSLVNGTENQSWAPKVSVDTIIPQLLTQAQRSVLIDVEINRHADPELLRLKNRHDIELAIPLIADQSLYGVVLVGRSEDGSLHDNITLDMLDILGAQIGLSLHVREVTRLANQTDKLLALGTMAAGLAHEIKNPLTSILTLGQLLREAPDTTLSPEYVAVLNKDIERIRSVVDSVAAFATSKTTKMTSVDLFDILKTASEMVQRDTPRTGALILIPAGESLPVLGNPGQLLQVFVNLFQNAFQAAIDPVTPVVTVTAKTRYMQGRAVVSVRVQDNGAGIPKEMLPRIFEAFATTKAAGARDKAQGMGLGLAIVLRLVQHHGGEIDVTSKLGAGTCFTVHLPSATTL